MRVDKTKGKDTIYARTRIRSAVDAVRKLRFGHSDEIHIYLDLKEGENELGFYGQMG